jgi:hypothetical protein
MCCIPILRGAAATSVVAASGSSGCSDAGIGWGGAGAESDADAGSDGPGSSDCDRGDWSASTTTSVTFCASVTSGEGTALDTGADEGAGEGIGGGAGVILRRFGALSPSVVSSSLSRLSSRGLSAVGEDTVDWAGA